MKIRNFRWNDEVDAKLNWLVENAPIQDSKKKNSRNRFLIGLIRSEHGAKQRDALHFQSNALQLEEKKERSE